MMPQPKKYLIVAALIGFVVPIFWGILAMVLFNLQHPFWTKVFWVCVYVTCPGWLIPGGRDWVIIATPFANALVYVLITYAWLIIRQRRKKGTA